MRLVLLSALALLCATGARAEDRRIKLINESRQIIVEFHASNVSRKNYEQDILGKRMIRPGESMVINIDDGSGYCKYDFLTVMRGGQKIEKRGIDVCKIETYRITD